MGFLNKMQKKFGKYAIPNLTRYIIGTYIIGYLLELISASGTNILAYLSLHPGLILHGQIWRLVTWVLVPPSSISVFTIIMLIVYYQLGTVLERVWGDFLYNFYIFFGLLMTVIGSFVIYYLIPNGNLYVDYSAGLLFSTYYVSLSIFLGFAMTFPEQEMLLFFIIPLKIKYLAVIDIAYLVYRMVAGGWVERTLIICSLASTILFLLMFSRSRAKSRKRANDYRKASQPSRPKQMQARGYIHKCAICGRTEKDDPDLVFRYCSKCSGNREYCQQHLFTHEHV